MDYVQRVYNPIERNVMTGALYGYARCSTDVQENSMQHQTEVLKAAGCHKVHGEYVSAVGKERPKLVMLLEFLEDGDTLVVTKMDRLARSVLDMNNIVTQLKDKGAKLKVLDSPFDMTTPTGELMVNILASFAQFERSLMLERQAIGIAKAKEKGKYKGRKPTARVHEEEVKRLHQEGLKPSEISRKLNISTASVYRFR